MVSIDILLVEHPDAPKVLLQRGNEGSGQDRRAVFLPFAVADSDLAIGKVEILDS